MISEDNVRISEIELNALFDGYQVTSMTRERCEKQDIVIMPHHMDKECHFMQESVPFVKYTRKNFPDIRIDVLADEGNLSVKALHSFDIWMPVVYIAGSILLPFAINLISNYVYDKIKGREKEVPILDVNVYVKDGEKVKTLSYKGDARKFKEVFEKIDFNKL